NGRSQIAKSGIKAIGLRGDELATGIFEKECLERAKWKRVAIKKDSAEVLAAVSMDPQAIGFVDLAGIPATGQSIKILAIKLGTGERAKLIQPTPENIKSAMYPLSQRLWLYVHPQASDTAKDFVKFIATCGASEASPYADTVKAVMDTYRKNGLVPLADAALLRMTKDAMAEDAARAKAEDGKGKVGSRRDGTAAAGRE
ncbi:MAG: substrate-binding domain-containing protein, partial [Planctomycetota bacterium]|nr:substrate-binding domain-containing protein [Planctomycetota bacterium]